MVVIIYSRFDGCNQPFDDHDPRLKWSQKYFDWKTPRYRANTIL